MSFFKNIRFWVLVFSFVLSIYYYLSISSVVLLIQSLALTAVAFLYLTLLAGPLTYTFKFLPFRVQYLKARRALGVSTFYFALLHASIAFFGQLGGFGALPIIPARFQIAIFLGFISLTILTFMAATANDYMIEKLGFNRWKFIHRFVYLVGISVLIHVILIGSHFQTLNPFSIISYIFVAFLVALQIPRILKWRE